MTIEDRRNWMWSEALQMLARADRLHREVFNPPATGSHAAAGWEPPVDVLETEDAVLVLAALPGVNAQQVRLVIHNENTRYLRARYDLPGGGSVLAPFPAGVLPVEGGHFGANLIAYILDQYHQAQVTQPLLLAQLSMSLQSSLVSPDTSNRKRSPCGDCWLASCLAPTPSADFWRA